VGSASCTDVEVENDGAALATVPGTLDPGTYDVIAQDGADTFVFPSGFTVQAAAAAEGCACGASSPGGSAFVVVVGMAVLVRLRIRRRR
jgi:MYXO-CTERM domain-containing protein